MKKSCLMYLIPLLSTLLFVVLQVEDPLIIRDHLESKTYDLRLLLRNLIKEPPPVKYIVIVAIDDKSLKEIGRWPWGRDIQAKLVKKISDAGPKVIGIDVMFTERESLDIDNKLAEAIKKAGNVVLATAFDVPHTGKAFSPPKDVPDFLWDSAFMEVRSQKGIKWKDFAVKAEKVMPALNEISTVAALGHVYTLPDMDGSQRWDILSLFYGEDCYPQFALQIARIALGVPMRDMILYGGSGIGLGNAFIPTDLYGRVVINYRGQEKSFPYISASDVIKDRVPSDVLKDKIVLVGASALATYDQKVTPFSVNMPGIEKNANVVENILLNNFIRKSPGVMELIVIILTGILLGLTVPRLKAVFSASFAVSFILIYILVCCYLLIYHNLWANLLYPVANMFGIFVALTVIRFVHEEKNAREIRRMFSNYVSPKIVNELIENPGKATLSGERRTVTVLFSDIIDFTSFSEKRQPEEVVSLLNEYFQKMVEVIFKWDGTLDKFIGDELMVLWSAPIEQPNHAELALRCALDMSESFKNLQEKWKKRGSYVLDVGIGINTGEVIIGNIGAPGKKMDYTVIGDHVNLAARVEKLTRQYGSRILITENTFKYVEPIIKKGLFGHLELRGLAFAKVKGREKEVKIFELKGTKE